MFTKFSFFCHGLFALTCYVVTFPFWFLLGIPTSSLKYTNLSGKVAVVTGSNTGIGKETALNLCSQGATVVLACRNLEQAEATANFIRLNSQPLYGTCGKVEVRSLDLSNLVSVVDFVDRLFRDHKCVHILVNNAGCNIQGITGHGLQQLFQVNYLGHYLLVRLFLIRLQQAPSGELRVVNLSSVMHHCGSDEDIEGSSLPLSSKHHSYYDDSKYFMNLLTHEINRKYAKLVDNRSIDHSTRVLAVSVNPGAVRSDIWRHIPTVVKVFFDFFMRVVFLDVNQGCQTSVAAASIESTRLLTMHQFSGHHSSELSWTRHPLVPYLIPYYLPFKCLGFEMLGPYSGPQAGDVSMSPNHALRAQQLWTYSQDLCESILKQNNKHVIF